MIPLRKSYFLIALPFMVISCKKEITLKKNESIKTDTVYSETTVDTTTSGTKETLLKKVDYAIWSMGNLEEYFLNKLSKATNKSQGNEIYEEYVENMENRIGMCGRYRTISERTGGLWKMVDK